MKKTTKILVFSLLSACSAPPPSPYTNPNTDSMTPEDVVPSWPVSTGGSSANPGSGGSLPHFPSSSGGSTDSEPSPLGSGGHSEGSGGSLPAGTGGDASWISDYTFTFFGQSDCTKFNAHDVFSIDTGTCSGQVSLTEDVRSFYAAPGDLSSIWQGAPCDDANPPNCFGQQNCGLCVELKCDPGGPHYHPADSYKDPHGAFCRTDQSVVVKIVDACPALHPNNNHRCTAARPHHIDISCSAFRALTIDENNGGRVISQIGSINGQARIVDCSVGLGAHDL